MDVQLAALRQRGLPGVRLNVNAANRRALGFCHHLGFTGFRTGDRNILGLKPR
jgi:ribosomal protein S18 acetylase RimI-like enzyme